MKILTLLFLIAALSACDKIYTNALGSYQCTDAQHLKAYTEARQAFELAPTRGFDFWYGNAIRRNCEVLGNAI